MIAPFGGVSCAQIIISPEDESVKSKKICFSDCKVTKNRAAGKTTNRNILFLVVNVS
jgi:hypothetical protein